MREKIWFCLHFGVSILILLILLSFLTNRSSVFNLVFSVGLVGIVFGILLHHLADSYYKNFSKIFAVFITVAIIVVITFIFIKIPS